MALFGLFTTRSELREIYQADADFRAAAAKYRLAHAAYTAAPAGERECERIALIAAYRRVSDAYAEIATLRKLPPGPAPRGTSLPAMPGIDALPDVP